MSNLYQWKKLIALNQTNPKKFNVLKALNETLSKSSPSLAVNAGLSRPCY